MGFPLYKFRATPGRKGSSTTIGKPDGTYPIYDIMKI